MTSNRVSSSSGFTRVLAHRARRDFPLTAGVAVLLFVAGAVAAAGQTQIPASATLRDSTTDGIRSDNFSPSPTYDQGKDCVTSWVRNGEYFLRTVGPLCTPQTPREIILDFSNIVTHPSNCDVVDLNSGMTLNACGSNLLPDVRIIAQSLFKASPGSTTVSLPFSLQPDFTGSSDFELDFELAVPFTGSGSQRILTAGSNAVAQLYQIGAHGHKISIGRYKMPFQLTVTEH
jgi:hypothetical protein